MVFEVIRWFAFVVVNNVLFPNSVRVWFVVALFIRSGIQRAALAGVE